jgi:DNA-binding protein YbaB
MFGNMMGDMDARKEEMQKKLASISLKEVGGDGAVVVEADATRRLLNISIDRSKMASDDAEELEDLLLITINRVMDKAAEKEAEEAQKMIQEMLPPGLGNLFGGL